MPVQACEPRDFLLFLPRLGEVMLQAASYVHTCAVISGITYLPEDSDDPVVTAVTTGGPPGGAGGGGAHAAPVTMAEVTQGKQAVDEMADHLAGLAVRAFRSLRRKSAAHACDVLAFVGKLTMAYVRLPARSPSMPPGCTDWPARHVMLVAKGLLRLLSQQPCCAEQRT